jgi:hypothetical protein
LADVAEADEYRAQWLFLHAAIVAGSEIEVN